ncbi:MAG: hypothetical protein O9353_03550, partial [Bacteroidia bacterium]|nr:hypothetical protein [Bacteroidia bacterium]
FDLMVSALNLLLKAERLKQSATLNSPPYLLLDIMFPDCAVKAQEKQDASMMKKHLIHKYTKKTIQALCTTALQLLKVCSALRHIP